MAIWSAMTRNRRLRGCCFRSLLKERWLRREFTTRLMLRSRRTLFARPGELRVNRRRKASGDKMAAHGFRAIASTLLNQSRLWSSDAIERALAHDSSSSVRGTYHRGAHWDERVKMAQWWSNYLDELQRTSLQ